jgi:hypothetical protein
MDQQYVDSVNRAAAANIARIEDDAKQALADIDRRSRAADDAYDAARKRLADESKRAKDRRLTQLASTRKQLADLLAAVRVPSSSLPSSVSVPVFEPTSTAVASPDAKTMAVPAVVRPTVAGAVQPDWKLEDHPPAADYKRLPHLEQWLSVVLKLPPSMVVSTTVDSLCRSAARNGKAPPASVSKTLSADQVRRYSGALAHFSALRNNGSSGSSGNSGNSNNQHPPASVSPPPPPSSSFDIDSSPPFLSSSASSSIEPVPLFQSTWTPPTDLLPVPTNPNPYDTVESPTVVNASSASTTPTDSGNVSPNNNNNDELTTGRAIVGVWNDGAGPAGGGAPFVGGFDFAIATTDNSNNDDRRNRRRRKRDAGSSDDRAGGGPERVAQPRSSAGLPSPSPASSLSAPVDAPAKKAAGRLDLLKQTRSSTSNRSAGLHGRLAALRVSN